MREILFRGLTTKGEFVFGSLVNTTRGIKHMPNKQSKTWIITSAFGNGGWFNVHGRSYVRSETVGQFTGLTDCNGVKIFESDILRCADDYLWVVAFDDRGSFIAHEPKDNLVFLMIDDCNFEVIGNIHQNPELLERTHG